MTEGTDLARLGALLDAYGGGARRWPEADRAWALRLIAVSPEAARLHRQATALDALLDEAMLAPASPQDLIPLDGPGARAVAIEATLRAADLAQHPRRGDLLRWGSPLVTYRVETARPDPLGLSWTLGLVRTS